MSEHALQCAVAHMLQLVLDPERTWFSAIDHAAKLSPRYGAERKRRGVRAGMPDFILMWKKPADLFSSFIGIEMKYGKGKLSTSQVETAAAWAKMDHNIYVARSLAEVQEILDHCHVPMLRRMTLFLEPDHDRRPARAARPRHPRTQRRRKSKGALPLV